MTESQLTAKAIAQLKKIPSCWYLKIHGHHMQRAGVPDFLVIIQGRTFFVEFKTATGKVSRLQRHEHGKIRGAGVPVYVVRSVEELEATLMALSNDERGIGQ